MSHIILMYIHRHLLADIRHRLEDRLERKLDTLERKRFQHMIDESMAKFFSEREDLVAAFRQRSQAEQSVEPQSRKRQSAASSIDEILESRKTPDLETAQPRAKAQRTLPKILTYADIGPDAASADDDDIVEVGSNVPCPICNKMFRSDSIERHANRCLDSVGSL